MDNSVYVETYYVVRGRFKRYLLKPVVRADVLQEHKSDPELAEAEAALRDPACIAWTWAQKYPSRGSNPGLATCSAPRLLACHIPQF